MNFIWNSLKFHKLLRTNTHVGTYKYTTISFRSTAPTYFLLTSDRYGISSSLNLSWRIFNPICYGPCTLYENFLQEVTHKSSFQIISTSWMGLSLGTALVWIEWSYWIKGKKKIVQKNGILYGWTKKEQDGELLNYPLFCGDSLFKFNICTRKWTVIFDFCKKKYGV